MRPFRQQPRSPTLLLVLVFLLAGFLGDAAGAAVHVAVIGDYGDNSPDEAAVANLVHSFVPDIVVTAGDNSYAGNPIDTNIGKYFSRYIGNYTGAYQPGASINSFFPSLGNHDYSDGGGVNSYLNYFTLPGASIQSTNTSGNERYYDFVYGPIHFFAINSNAQEPHGRGATSVQAQWLRARLAASTAPWKIVYFHHSPYSSGEHGGAEVMRWPYRDWGADAVLGGHDHNYERFLIDGFPYFVVGFGGSSLRAFHSPQPGSIVRYNANFGAMLITADAGQLTFEAFSVASGYPRVDSYTLTRVATVPDLLVTPSQFRFSSVTVGEMAMATFGLRNDGVAALAVQAITINGAAAVDFSAERARTVMPRHLPEIGSAASGPFVVPPGATVPVVVRFLPLSVGSKSATLRVVSNDPDQGIADFPLSGDAVPEPQPNIAVSPLEMDLGELPAFTSDTDVVNVRNWGNATLEIASATLTGGDVTHFAVTAGGGSFALTPGHSADVWLRFAPTSMGPKATTLRLTSNDPDMPNLNVPLHGLGLAQLPAQIEVVPATYNFGTTVLFTTATSSVKVRNSGAGPLQVSGVSLLGPEAAQFACTAPGDSFTVAPGDSTTLAVHFTPVTLGGKSATLRLQSNDAESPAVDVPLSGAGGLPNIVVFPLTRKFANTVIFTHRATFVWVRNTGSAALQVSSVGFLGPNATEFSITAGGGAFMVAPSDSSRITVRFAPVTVGSKSATLRIQSNDPDTPALDVAFSGTGLPPPIPNIVASPTIHDFGAHVILTSTSTSFWIRNTGGPDLQVSGVSLLGPQAAEFAVTAGGGAFSVAYADSSEIEVTFSPVTVGSKSAILHIQSNDPDTPTLDLPLSGIALPPPAPEVAVSTTVCDFGGVLAGGGTATQVLVVRNEGNLGLSVSQTSITGVAAADFAITSGAGPFSVAPGDSVVLSLRFAPPSAGVKNATLVIQSNDPDQGLLEVALAGIGIVASTAPVPVAFQEIVEGSSTNATNVVTARSVAAVAGGLYLAAVSSRPLLAVTGVTGLGLAWSRVRAQCSGRSQTGVEIWVGTGTPIAGVVTASFAGSTNSAALLVSRYAGTDPTAPLRAVVSANTNGVQGGCSGGTDTASYSMTLPITVDGSVPFIAAAIRNRDLSLGTGYTLRAVTRAGTGGSMTGLASIDRSAAAPGNVNLSGTFNQTVDWAVATVAIAPAALFPEITVTPGSHDYGALYVGSTGTTSFVIRNDGSATLHLPGIGLLGPQAADFVLTSGGVAPPLGPGASHTVSVDFTPAAAGTRSALLRLVSDDLDELTLDFPLTGTGVPAFPDLTVSPASLDFGSIPALTTASRSLLLDNLGQATLQVTEVALTGTDAASFGWSGATAPFSLLPGTNFTLGLTFAPTTPGTKTATLRLTSNDPDQGVVEVPLSGTASSPLLPDIAVLPGSLDFGAIAVNSSAAGQVRVRNQGTATLFVTGTAIVGTDSLSFALGSSGTFALAPGDSTNVALTFAPTSAGAKSAALRLTSNDPDDNPVLVDLTGTGVVVPQAEVVFEGSVRGSSTNSTSVTTASIVPVQSGDLVLAAVATKAYVNVTAVSGLGLTWTRVRGQCGGRSQTGVQLWLGAGTPSPGLVTASLASAPASAALLVARYSGADPVTPLGPVVAANTLGVGGTCSGGTDTASYAMSLQTTMEDAVVFAAVAMRSRILTPGSGYVVRDQLYAGPTGSVAGLAVVDQVFASPGTKSVNGSFDGPVDWAVVGVEIRPYLGATKQEREAESVRTAGLSVGGSAGAAWLELATPQAARAQLRVLDVRGRVRKTLYDGVLPAGRTRLPWGGQGAAALPTGIYFLQADIGSQRFVRKALLLH